MSVSIPAAGDPITYSWGAGVAAVVNSIIVVDCPADYSTNSATASTVTGMTFPVVSGKRYVGRLLLRTSVNATNQGIQLGMDGPAATAYMLFVLQYGNGATTTPLVSRMGSLGVTSSLAATATTNIILAHIDFVYIPSADGTMNVVVNRGGTSGSPGVTVYQGSGGLVTVSG